MEKTILYYFPPICIIIFTFILIFIAPNTSRSLPNSKYWKSINYKKYSDYAEDIKNSIITQGIKDINYLKDKLGVILRERNLCQRKKIMHGLEYASIVSNFYFSIVNIFLFIIIVKNESNNKLYIRLIIIITGIISFILNLLYAIFSTYIFKNDITFKEDLEKQIYNKWLCSIVFSLLITIANIFLVISGFLLFKKNSEYASIS